MEEKKPRHSKVDSQSHPDSDFSYFNFHHPREYANR